jgi:hypothetical protein
MRLLDRFLRRESPPSLPPLVAGDRVVAWGTTGEGEAAVASSRALWLPLKRANAVAGPTPESAADAPGPRWQRLGWAEIHKAAWAEGVLVITPGVEVEPGVVVDGPIRRVRLADPRDLPAEVRTRVTRSVAYTSQHRLRAGGTVRVVARRVPGQNGLTWQLRFDDGADRADPGLRAEAEGVLTEVRSHPL